MDIIKNSAEIATSSLRGKVLAIIEQGIKSAAPAALLGQALKYNSHLNTIIINNHNFDIISGRVFVIGGGKAAGAMAEALEQTIGPDNIAAGIVNTDGRKYNLRKITGYGAGHPLPDNRAYRGVKKMLGLKEKYRLNEKDAVVCLVSGGASAMMPCPADGVSLDDKKKITRLLLESGADIKEINIVRKHLSKIKGGQLAAHFYPSKVISIIISDVAGDNLDVIASGLTAPDPSTFGGALAVLEKYNLDKKAPKAVLVRLKSGMEGEAAETAKELKNANNFIIGKNADVLEEMARHAKSLGLAPLIVSAELSGDTAIAADLIAEEIKKGEYSEYGAIILGGETTPALPKDYGQGGRNLHFAALSLLALENLKTDWAMTSVATDGRDYTKNIAGAIIDSHTLDIARAKNIAVEEHIKNFDTYRLFKKLGNCLIRTDRTGTNVGDVILYILK